MGIDMYLEQSQLQSSSVATMCQSQVEAYQDLQSAIQKFSEDTESLKGDAYNSARSFFASVLLPLSKGDSSMRKPSLKPSRNCQKTTKRWSTARVGGRMIYLIRSARKSK